MKIKGFTLIEIMVAIAIISLLSSIVLGMINDARQRALATKYRSSVQEFIKALEVYYSNNDGVYPGESSSVFSLKYTKDGVLTESPSGLLNQIRPYLQELPKPSINGSFEYMRNYNNLTPGTDNYVYRCAGHSNDIPPAKYVILVNKDEPKFLDWPLAEIKNYNNTEKKWIGNNSVPTPAPRCYSRN